VLLSKWGAFACSAFSRPKWVSVAKSGKRFEERDWKARSKKASFTFGRDLWLKAREQNLVTESRRTPSSLGKCQGYRKEAWLLPWVNESRMIVRLYPELKLGKDNSDPIKVRSELNCTSSPRPYVCVLATEIFQRFTRIHLIWTGFPHLNMFVWCGSNNSYHIIVWRQFSQPIW